jgi:saccharopine dehydrogenase-like NADP-dependent oxidoreductase
LPHKDNIGNSLGYKFSWAPQGALGAVIRPYRIRRNGEVVENNGIGLMDDAEDFEEEGLQFYPNGDAEKYAEIYGIPEAKDIVRCSLRYKGFAENMRMFVEVGLFNKEM